MNTPSQQQLITDLKQLIITECDKDIGVDEISDNEILFGPDAPLQLDSLDALQISIAIQNRYGKRMVDSKETRRVMSSVANLAAFLDL